MVLLYPAISLVDSLAKSNAQKTAGKRFLGDHATTEQLRFYSAELNITHQTSPTFLVHAKDDQTVTVKNSIVFYNGLIKNKVPAEIHLYEKGGHGFGLINPTDANKWTDWLKVWLQTL